VVSEIVTLDLAFDDAQQAIHDASSQLCRDRCSDAVVKAASGSFPSGLWKAMAELGVLAIATPDGDGGASELVAACEALGRAVFPGPLAASICAAQLLPPREREAVTSGLAVVSLGWPPLMAWAPAAQIFVEIDGEFAHLARPGCAIEPIETLGGEPWGRVQLVRTAPLGDARRALTLHDIALAAYLAAAGTRLVEDAAEHARTRKQFGRAIGEFQAVAHPLADAWVQLAGAATLARGAAFRFDRGRGGALSPEAIAAAGAARLSAARSALGAAHVCHQVFGAIGITLEGPVFHVSRRIRQLASAPQRDAPARAAVLASFGL
jgi:alkylation response protein AidB-like acyl-CoA dehydrogenase